MGAMPLVGFLWKRGSSWRSFSYHRRFFYLTAEALCYRNKPPPQQYHPHDAIHTEPLAATDKDERRIPLATITSVRMHSKLKYEFEVVCKARAYRLRAPSAQSLAVWVTAISSEWMTLQHSSTQLDPMSALQMSAARPCSSSHALQYSMPPAVPPPTYPPAQSAAPAPAPLSVM